MPYVPGCRYDLFISYASENDRDGWVTQFVAAIGQELGDLLGRHFSPKDSIFFDRNNLQTAQSFPQELAAAARDSAILIPLLSPSYLTSWWCDRERTEFFGSMPHRAEEVDCLAPVVVRPFEEARLDSLYRKVLRVSFLSADGQTPVAPGSPEWASMYREFARQLRNALEKLRRKCRPIFVSRGPEQLRNWCQAELQRRQFRTTPETLTELNDAERCRVCLQEALLALHFLGGSEPASFETIEASVALCPGPTILYQPFGADLTADERIWLSDFEHDLQSEPGRYQRLAEKCDQELLALIDEQVTRPPGAAAGKDVPPRLALICDAADLNGVRQLQREIQTKGPLEVQLPDFLADRLRAMDRLRKWSDFLVRGDAQIFYYGATDPARLEAIWLKAQQQKPEARRNWYVAPPDVEDKRRSYPEALWNVDQVLSFLERARGANAP
ncbi:MAG: toll/interleukin-1 receptor domain-containing protein [Bryobacterales bacterium]|nr:toll/interleukin-1 receptor domain-containing protein [Bryobacterales bacterium]